VAALSGEEVAGDEASLPTAHDNGLEHFVH
jgi:hypothetical protein